MAERPRDRARAIRTELARAAAGLESGSRLDARLSAIEASAAGGGR